MQSVTDYSMARRAVLADLKAGRAQRSDVCDAHPELLRVARHHGDPCAAPCPVCGTDALVRVVFAFGDRLGRRNGGPVPVGDVPRLTAIDDVRCFSVEVCPDCRWNHLERVFTGRDAPADATDAAPGDV